MKRNSFLTLCAILLSITVLLAACSSSAGSAPSAPSTTQNYATGGKGIMPAASAAPASAFDMGTREMMVEDAAAVPPAESPNPSVGGGAVGGGEFSGILPNVSAQQALTDRKIVTTYDLSVETTEFDETIRYLNEAVEAFGGYIESSSVQGKSIQYEDYNARWARFSLRIPAESVRQFVATLGDRYNVINTDEYSDDITDSYYDSKARLTSLTEQEKQLNGLLETGGDLEYILEVHRELANVRYQIENLNSALQRMDKSVTFSTARVFLQEVMVYKSVDPMPMSFGERVGQALAGSWSGFTRSVQAWSISFIYNLPYYIINLFWLAVVIFVALRIRRAIRKRNGTIGAGAKPFWKKRVDAPTQEPPVAAKDLPVAPPEEETPPEE